nr:mucin-5AC-like [Biomphalaria glabrata]
MSWSQCTQFVSTSPLGLTALSLYQHHKLVSVHSVCINITTWSQCTQFISTSPLGLSALTRVGLSALCFSIIFSLCTTTFLETPVSNVTPASNVDLLFGVDAVDVKADETITISDVRVSNPPDVLDFLDLGCGSVPATISTMEDEIILTEPPNELIIPDINKEISVDIQVIKDGMDISVEEEDKVKEQAENEEKEKMETSSNEDKVDGIPVKYDDDLDFSLLKQPGMSLLNFEVSKHKRSLSQKGSIANRKKPTRAAILPSDNEERIFIDSSESKPVKTDDLDGCTSSKVKEPDSPLPPIPAAEEDKLPSDPGKRFGGVKIPGLLEGLSKNKVFTKNEKTEVETDKCSDSKVLNPAERIQASDNDQAPQIKSKPLVLPRVLPSVIPRPATKVLKETQNHSTVSDASPATRLLEKDKQSSTAPERRNTKLSFGANKVLPSKPDINLATPAVKQEVAKPPAKIPPPVPSKPSVPLKPARTMLGSASFSVADRPGMSKKSALPSLTSHSKGLDFTDSPDGNLNIESATTDSNSVLKTNPIAASKISSTLGNITTEPDISKNTTITRASSLRAPGYTEMFKFKTRDADPTKVSNVETLNTTGKVSGKDGNSFETIEKSEPSSVAKEELVVLRKSSISGVSSVKSPSVVDKSQSNGSRRGSFTGSAYNPIGFRPSVASADTEASKSRSNSVSDETPSTTEVTAPSTDVKAAKEITNGIEAPRLRNSSFNTIGSSSLTTASSVKHSEDLKSAPPVEEKKKDVTNETNKLIRDQAKLSKESLTPVKTPFHAPPASKSDSTQEKASPWKVQLRKVEKKEKTPEPQTSTQENDSPNNWRQQMAQKRRSMTNTRVEPDKTKDTTPEWARASIHRRQRLIESGIISAEGK